MSLRKTKWVALVLIVSIPLGCGDDKSKPSGAASASAAVSASAPPPEPLAAPSASAAPSAAGSGAPEKPKVVRRPGSVGEFFNQARALDLKEEQKAKLDEIDEKLYGESKEEEETKTALKEFGTALIEGVKAGRVETAKLGPHYATLEKVAKERHDTEAKALNDLHATLDATQRKALVDVLRRRHPSQAKKPPAPAKPATAKPPAAKPAKPPTPAKPPAPPAPKVDQAAERAKRRIERVGALLGLDDMQKKRVAPILARFDTEPLNKATRQKIEKRMQALLDAFEKDEFDATKLDLGAGPKARMENRVAFITTLLAVIKADQREKLARTIERPGARRWGAAIVGEAGPIDDE